MAKNLMIQGTMSNAGKSLLAAGLCRVLHQDGYKVAPFKSQNMALNSFITAGGGEMGRAQVVQAEAAGILPDVRMNPILLKPTTDMGSQVIVDGTVRGTMKAAEYYRRKPEFLPAVLEAYRSLAEEYDIIVIEGAGSPAEINLKKDDFVNMGLARLVDAQVLLVGDIDRGGVFAQLYGTVALLEADERSRVKGVVVNKFRGDRTILEPGLAQLEELCGVPVAGVLPYLHVDIDDEDSLSGRFSRDTAAKLVDIAVIRLPRISNFTDLGPFERYENVSVRYVASVRELGAPDCIVLPGTKSTIGDLLWLRQSGLEAAVKQAASRGTLLVGICGGYQMLGREIADPKGAEAWACWRWTPCSRRRRCRPRPGACSIRWRACWHRCQGWPMRATRFTWAAAGRSVLRWPGGGTSTGPTSTVYLTPPAWRTRYWRRCAKKRERMFPNWGSSKRRPTGRGSTTSWRTPCGKIWIWNWFTAS